MGLGQLPNAILALLPEVTNATDGDLTCESMFERFGRIIPIRTFCPMTLDELKMRIILLSPGLRAELDAWEYPHHYHYVHDGCMLACGRRGH
eukprot:4689348-Prymnesium_polylepis.1